MAQHSGKKTNKQTKKPKYDIQAIVWAERCKPGDAAGEVGGLPVLSV